MTGTDRWRELTAVQVSLLDHIERAVRNVAHPVDCPQCLNRCIALALEDEGLYSTSEVPLPPGRRRVDIVVVSAAGTCAVEVDGREVRSETLGKFRDLDPTILRMSVLRNRKQRPVVPFCDRVVCLSASQRPLRLLVDGPGPQTTSIFGGLRSAPRRGPRSASDRSGLLTVRKVR